MQSSGKKQGKCDILCIYPTCTASSYPLHRFLPLDCQTGLLILFIYLWLLKCPASQLHLEAVTCSEMQHQRHDLCSRPPSQIQKVRALSAASVYPPTPDTHSLHPAWGRGGCSISDTHFWYHVGSRKKLLRARLPAWDHILQPTEAFMHC